MAAGLPGYFFYQQLKCSTSLFRLLQRPVAVAGFQQRVGCLGMPGPFFKHGIKCG